MCIYFSRNMVEVVKSTFEETFPAIEQAIRHSDFIAIDTEFTGIQLNEQCKPSLFDNSAERYRVVRKTISQITICQLGLSIFTKDPNDNRYDVKTYNFYLYPKPFGPVDERFICQASSLHFLCRYKFDFNKFIYQGIPYLNETQEKQIRKYIESKAMFAGLERDLDEYAIQKVCSHVADWIVNTESDSILTLQKDDIESIPVYLLNTEIRERFPNVWTTILPKSIEIELKKIDPKIREELQKAEALKQKENEQVINNLLGFTRIFQLLVECKKPLIGHNMLMDLMLIYDKFYRPLPSSVTEFCQNLHSLFPIVFDTKQVASSLRKSLEESGFLQNTTLADLYMDMESPRGRDLVIHAPTIGHADGFDRYKNNDIPHEAGYDAYMAGFVFLRLAHFKTFRDIKSTEVIPCLFRRYIAAMKGDLNKVNMIRATVNFMQLDGADPVSVRPELLYVRSRLLERNLDIEQLAKWFSPYGSVDIKSINESKALVATGNHICAKQILKAFRKHNGIYIAKYSVWRHSPIVRGLLWSGLVISGSVCLWALLSKEKKT